MLKPAKKLWQSFVAGITNPWLYMSFMHECHPHALSSLFIPCLGLQGRYIATIYVAIKMGTQKATHKQSIDNINTATIKLLASHFI